MNPLSRWWRSRRLARCRIPDAEFAPVLANLPILAGFTTAEYVRLFDAASLFMADKAFSTAGDAQISPHDALGIALQASLLRLGHAREDYPGWSEIILYPAEFIRPREEADEAGVVHVSRDILAGEAWSGGPVVLSLADVATSGQGTGYNVVLHEFAHKLDMENDGDANGLPTLPDGMRRADWARALGEAYEALCAEVDAGHETAIDPYASESPGEFFAVLTEYFFEAPDLVAATYPAVYAQFRQYYGQDPLARMESLG